MSSLINSYGKKVNKSNAKTGYSMNESAFPKSSRLYAPTGGTKTIKQPKQK